MSRVTASLCLAPLRLIFPLIGAVAMTACGGGVGPPTATSTTSVITPAVSPAITPAPELTPAPNCPDPVPSPVSSAVFETPSGAAASGVLLSRDGSSACFMASKAFGVRSQVAAVQGPESFYYFEASRSSFEHLYIGVGGVAPTEAGPGLNLAPTADSLVAWDRNTLTKNPAGEDQYGGIGRQDVMGYAVDYRGKYPVVYVIGDASAADESFPCPGGAKGPAPCVFQRVQLADTTGSLYIYAYGTTDGAAADPRVSINTGSDLVTRPYTYSQAEVRKALRAAWYQGDRGLNPQWPSRTGPRELPALTRSSRARAVIRLDDPKAYISAFTAKSGGDTASIQWVDGNGLRLGTGGTLDLTPTLLASLGAGDHQIMASVVGANSGLYVEVSFQLTVVPSGSNPDNDLDGLTYDQEKAAGTDPANPDTDGDGLSDGAEVALGSNPALADTDRDGLNDGRQLARDSKLSESPLRLVADAGTSRGVVVSDDGYSAALTSEVNQDCVQRKGDFAKDAYSDIGSCYKRGVRTNGAIKPGEFRYFETHRLNLTSLDNLGQGVITAVGSIDPYCCYVGATLSPLTPVSMSVNSVGSMFVGLVDGGPGYDNSLTSYYGFAVDYTGPEPLVHVVTTAVGAGMSITRLEVPGFKGADVVPFIYGHPLSDVEARSAINLGLQAFHYDTSAIRAHLIGSGVDVRKFEPGVGIHRRP